MPYFPRTLNPGPDEGAPDYRMSLLPFGTYPNAAGSGDHLGFAVPGMISEPVNALARLMGTPSHPGTFTQGPDAPGNADDMRTLLETFFGGQAMRGTGAAERGMAEAANVPHQAVITQPSGIAAALSDKHFLKSIDTNWYHAAQPDFTEFHDPTDYLGIHMTNYKPLAKDYQAERGGPMVEMDAPFEKPFTLPPYGSQNYDAALKDAQSLLPGFDGTKDSLERNAAAYRQILRDHGYDSIVSQDERLLDDAHEAIALNPKSFNGLFSDQMPSLLGAAIGSSDPQYPIPSHATGSFDNALMRSPPNPVAAQSLGFDAMDLREQSPQVWDPSTNYLSSLAKIRGTPRF